MSPTAEAGTDPRLGTFRAIKCDSAKKPFSKSESQKPKRHWAGFTAQTITASTPRATDQPGVLLVRGGQSKWVSFLRWSPGDVVRSCDPVCSPREEPAFPAALPSMSRLHTQGPWSSAFQQHELSSVLQSLRHCPHPVSVPVTTLLPKA